MAAVVVTNFLDVVNGDVSSLSALLLNAGGDGISLREAIEASNNTPGADEISFDIDEDSSHTIELLNGELVISDALTLSGGRANDLTIDALEQSRLFRIDDPSSIYLNEFEVRIEGVTLTRGRTTAAGSPGGAILAKIRDLFVSDCIVNGNQTTGDTSWGGAIFSYGFVTISNSLFRDNHTTGSNSSGGAVFARGDVTINDSSLVRNSTKGYSASAGSIRSNGEVVLYRSTVADSWTEGDEAPGGGVHAVGNIIVDSSTISSNYTLGSESVGGGVFTHHGVNVSQSTISGNSTAGIGSFGGGIYSSRNVQIVQSTITNNWTTRSGIGAGVCQADYSNDFPVFIAGTIIAGNVANGRMADLFVDPDSTLEFNYNLLGATFASRVTASTGQGNLLNVDATLGPLADNGGPTQTHALLPGSLAIDGGSPVDLLFDQRGGPYVRAAGEAATTLAMPDIGAYEAQGSVTVVYGDYNRDGRVDAADYSVWRDSVGARGTQRLSGADGTGDGNVTAEDYAVWRAHYGLSSPEPFVPEDEVEWSSEPARHASLDVSFALATLDQAYLTPTPASEANVLASPNPRGRAVSNSNRSLLETGTVATDSELVRWDPHIDRNQSDHGQLCEQHFGSGLEVDAWELYAQASLEQLE